MAEKLGLRPLTVDDAFAMVGVLGSPALYTYTGGEPPGLDELTWRYSVLARGESADGTERWLNFVITIGTAAQPIGFVQATIPAGSGPTQIGWLVGIPWQGRGFATRAVQLLLEELDRQDITQVVAHIHPDHSASQRVARNVGMVPTDEIVDGEVRWVGRGFEG